MAKKNEGRAVWFRMFRNIRNLVDAVPDESAGAAIKAVFAYFDTGELPTNLDTLGYALFLSIKPAVDESNEDYKRAVESGRKGSQKRWEGEDRPPIPSLTSPIAPLTEEEKETEKEIKKSYIKKQTRRCVPCPRRWFGRWSSTTAGSRLWKSCATIPLDNH